MRRHMKAAGKGVNYKRRGRKQTSTESGELPSGTFEAAQHE